LGSRLTSSANVPRGTGAGQSWKTTGAEPVKRAGAGGPWGGRF
jgi:hypothetical protein